MSRLPTFRLLTPQEQAAACARILSHPTSNAQRVSLDEIYSFAARYLQLAEICGIVSRQFAGCALETDDRALRGHMVALGCLPASVLTEPQEPPHVG